MNIEKFRHETPKNGTFVNESVVICNFSRSSRERAAETVDSQLTGGSMELANKSACIAVPACASKRG
jgi:hypothetical protein